MHACNPSQISLNTDQESVDFHQPIDDLHISKIDCFNQFNKQYLYMNISLVQLEYVLALSTYGSFVVAAEHCHVTQPTLSMQLKKMEEELGVLLFDRSKQPLMPTYVGAKVVEQARATLHEAHKIKEIVLESKGVQKSLTKAAGMQDGAWGLRRERHRGKASILIEKKLKRHEG